MNIACEMCGKKIGSLTTTKDALVKIDVAICMACDDVLWEKALKARQARKK